MKFKNQIDEKERSTIVQGVLERQKRKNQEGILSEKEFETLL